MKTIGEQYDGQSQQYASIEGWHGYFGHLNVLKLDHDDICTHYGKHDRVVTFLPQYEESINAISVYVRVDHVWQLGMPSENDIRDIVRKHDGTKGRWHITKTESCDKSTHVWLIQNKKA